MNEVNSRKSSPGGIISFLRNSRFAGFHWVMKNIFASAHCFPIKNRPCGSVISSILLCVPRKSSCRNGLTKKVTGEGIVTSRNQSMCKKNIQRKVLCMSYKKKSLPEFSGRQETKYAREI